MRRKLTVLVIAVVLLMALATPASAIRFGEPDGSAHPYVGVLAASLPGQSVLCSGVLISPTVFLTAGHCTWGMMFGHVWFEEDIEAGYPANGFPYGGGTSAKALGLYAHPKYWEHAYDSLFYLHDIGVVVLNEPVYMDTYGQLADIGLLDQLATKRGQQNQLFTVVGYGYQSIKPVAEWDLVRYQGTVKLIVPTDISAMFTTNPGHGGGACFGDSGGPVFLGDSNVIVGVTSFGMNMNCAGQFGGCRMDTENSHSFVNRFLSGHTVFLPLALAQ